MVSKGRNAQRESQTLLTCVFVIVYTRVSVDRDAAFPAGLSIGL
jgi:hypothetical protein